MVCTYLLAIGTMCAHCAVLFQSIFGGDDTVLNVKWRVHICDVTKACS